MAAPSRAMQSDRPTPFGSPLMEQHAQPLSTAYEKYAVTRQKGTRLLDGLSRSWSDMLTWLQCADHERT